MKGTEAELLALRGNGVGPEWADLKLMPVYKLLERPFAEMLLDRGAIRIGSIDYYRGYPGEDDWVSDESEGIFTVKHADGVYRYQDLPSGLKNFVRAEAGDTLKVGLKGVSEERVSENAMIYSIAKSPNKKAMERLGRDTCIEIASPDLFFREITRALFRNGYIKPGFHFKNVHYLRSPYSLPKYHQLHPAIVKRPAFRWQEESRAMWEPIGQHVSFIDIDVPEVRKYCRIVPPKNSLTSKHPDLAVCRVEHDGRIPLQDLFLINFIGYNVTPLLTGKGLLGFSGFVRFYPFQIGINQDGAGPYRELKAIFSDKKKARAFARLYPNSPSIRLNNMMMHLIIAASCFEGVKEWVFGEFRYWRGYQDGRILVS
ncbi:MAG: hypothetical protein R3F30_01340 [Planctomycetota bacterium]